MSRPDFLVCDREAYRIFVWAVTRDPYERVRLLFNAGCRGPDLWRRP
jgi:hypothetical protein